MADKAEGLGASSSDNNGAGDQDTENKGAENKDSENENQDTGDQESGNDDADKKDSDGKDSDKKDSDKTESDDDKPIEYTDFTVAEDFTIADNDVAFFKELRLSQDQAQKVIDYETERVKSLHQDIEKAQLEAIDKQAATWLSEAKSDKEYGGKDYEQNLSVANTAIAKLGSDKLVAVLTQTGLANHPEMIRFAYKVGKLVAEDTTTNDGPGGSEKSRAEKLYPK